MQAEERPAAAKATPPARREQARTVAAFALGGLGAIFAVLNVDEVEVNWLFGTWSTPLIIVIALAFVLGAGTGYLVARRRAAGPKP
jgi:uncharacterized integral membrane protein